MKDDKKELLKNKIINDENLTEKDFDDLFNLFTEKELTSTFTKEQLDNILTQVNSPKQIMSPKDICNSLVGAIVDAFQYCNELPFAGIEVRKEQSDYVRLIGGFQLFANNFVSLVDDLNAGKKDKNIINFKLPVE